MTSQGIQNTPGQGYSVTPSLAISSQEILRCVAVVFCSPNPQWGITESLPPHLYHSASTVSKPQHLDPGLE